MSGWVNTCNGDLFNCHAWVCRGIAQLGSTNQKIDIFKITCRVLLCLGVGLIKKTLAWQQILCITCSGKIEKYLQIESFSAVAIRNLVCCNQSSFSGLVTIFPITLKHKELFVIVCIPVVALFSSSIGVFFYILLPGARQLSRIYCNIYQDVHP